MNEILALLPIFILQFSLETYSSENIAVTRMS